MLPPWCLCLPDHHKSTPLVGPGVLEYSPCWVRRSRVRGPRRRCRDGVSGGCARRSSPQAARRQPCSRSFLWFRRRPDRGVIRLAFGVVNAVRPLIPRGNKLLNPWSSVPAALHCFHVINGRTRDSRSTCHLNGVNWCVGLFFVGEFAAGCRHNGADAIVADSKPVADLGECEAFCMEPRRSCAGVVWPLRVSRLRACGLGDPSYTSPGGS
jgi:hypothetical protein